MFSMFKISKFKFLLLIFPFFIIILDKNNEYYYKKCTKKLKGMKVELIINSKFLNC